MSRRKTNTLSMTAPQALLGVGFTFVARQKRIQLDGDDFYLDN